MEPVRVKGLLLGAAGLAAVAVAASGCGGDSASRAAPPPPPLPAAAKPSCAKYLAGWQKLANRIGAPVYCPAWMPEPLTGQITGRVNFGGGGGYTLSVSKDRSYLVSSIWREPQTGELHVNLRAYPGQTAIPRCESDVTTNGKLKRRVIPCFSDPGGTIRDGKIKATLYTVNQGADQWHILYAWRHQGTLYTVSQHVAEPLTYAMVKRDLRRILHNLVLVNPTA
jgi:hypothetical protein